MGIDRKDVRIVCHLNIPKSMEAFYQESGRAGRDQMPSRSVLYYGLDDRRKMMVEYCEDSGCRRKKILDCFGEKVLPSFCRKTCDACKHPNLVSGYLEELTHASSIHQKRLCPIFINSSLTIAPKELDSEFWNRDDEASHLDEEDISESDETDDTEVFKSLARSKLSSKAGLEEKLNFLEHAEEEYYQKKGSNKPTGADKRFISPTLREASKQRLLNALRQARERLKYGKAGKTFYNSQVASTIRWLSSSSNTEISDRVGSNSSQANESSGMDFPPSTSASLRKPADEEQKPILTREEEDHDIPSEAPIEHVKMEQPTVKKIELPPIPSFSEFVNKKEKDGKSNLSSASRRSFDAGTWRGDSGKLGRSDAEKRPKLQ
ncbi:ATP-dependent DNA helicase Q-like 3 [Acorus calamus]|uniref:DNA 3'-5' helicase n=1 Tax=Acorus calamus TaxID=4465 RepID=A0AAV9DLY7_ACOCL|nr:ATP-dependent DNA helicase Q-like 3 [Acorus calamus]